MVLKIRLRQQGRTNRAAYRLVVSDSRSPRDGKYVEMLGWYQPYESDEKVLHVESSRVAYWLSQGAQLTDKAKSLVKKAAPEVIKEYQAKVCAAQLKKCQKRKARKGSSQKQ